MTEPLLRLDQLASTLNLPLHLLAEIPPVRPARGRYVALYSAAAAREHLNRRGMSYDRLGAVLAS